MKSFADKKVVLIFLLILSGLLLGSALFITTGSNWTSLLTGQPYTEQIYTYDLAAVHDLAVDAQSNNIFLTGSDDASLKISCLKSEADSYKIRLSESGRLSIDCQPNVQFDNGGINWGTQNRTLIIFIPKQFSGTVKVTASSGTIAAAKLQLAGDVTLTSTSGRQKLTDIISDEPASFETLSGDIDITNGCFNSDCQLATKSGVIKTSATQIAGRLLATSGSGSINLAATGATGNVSLQSNSGAISFSDLGGNDIYLATGSGDISGSILGAADNYAVVTETHNQTENQPTAKNSDRLLKISTKSGNINIRFNETV
jgi:hypothetical protein